MLGHVYNFARNFLKSSRQKELELRFKPWFDAKGDKTLRVDYELTESSIVIDLGGYEGQWASDMFARYRCNIFVFEPMPQFADAIKRRFARNPLVEIFAFGLSSKNSFVDLKMGADESSQYKGVGDSISVQLVKATDFFAEHDVAHIDLMKINIEGGEYDLLEHLLDSGFVSKIRNIQVQFHDFVPNAASRMHHIQERLRTTHAITYQFPFVWENWRLRDEIQKQVQN